MTVYRQKGAPDPEEERARVEALHNSYPDVYGMPSVFNPSGLVPYPCAHGIPVKPKRFPYTKFKPWLDADGNEKPPFAGKSWGRSKHLRITAFGDRGGVPYSIAECVVCITGGAPEDFYTAADGSSLR